MATVFRLESVAAKTDVISADSVLMTARWVYQCSLMSHSFILTFRKKLTDLIQILQDNVKQIKRS